MRWKLLEERQSFGVGIRDFGYGKFEVPIGHSREPLVGCPNLGPRGKINLDAHCTVGN